MLCDVKICLTISNDFQISTIVRLCRVPMAEHARTVSTLTRVSALLAIRVQTAMSVSNCTSFLFKKLSR